MRAAVPRHPPLPTHDQEKDGNVFAWIIEQAPKVREARNHAEHERRALQRQRTWRESLPVKP